MALRARTLSGGGTSTDTATPPPGPRTARTSKLQDVDPSNQEGQAGATRPPTPRMTANAKNEDGFTKLTRGKQVTDVADYPGWPEHGPRLGPGTAGLVPQDATDIIVISSSSSSSETSDTNWAAPDQGEPEQGRGEQAPPPKPEATVTDAASAALDRPEEPISGRHHVSEEEAAKDTQGDAIHDQLGKGHQVEVAHPQENASEDGQPAEGRRLAGISRLNPNATPAIPNPAEGQQRGADIPEPRGAAGDDGDISSTAAGVAAVSTGIDEDRKRTAHTIAVTLLRTDPITRFTKARDQSPNSNRERLGKAIGVPLADTYSTKTETGGGKSPRPSKTPRLIYTPVSGGTLHTNGTRPTATMGPPSGGGTTAKPTRTGEGSPEGAGDDLTPARRRQANAGKSSKPVASRTRSNSSTRTRNAATPAPTTTTPTPRPRTYAAARSQAAAKSGRSQPGAGRPLPAAKLHPSQPRMATTTPAAATTTVPSGTTYTPGTGTKPLLKLTGWIPTTLPTDGGHAGAPQGADEAKLLQEDTGKLPAPVSRAEQQRGKLVPLPPVGPTNEQGLQGMQTEDTNDPNVILHQRKDQQREAEDGLRQDDSVEGKRDTGGKEQGGPTPKEGAHNEPPPPPYKGDASHVRKNTIKRHGRGDGGRERKKWRTEEMRGATTSGSRIIRKGNRRPSPAAKEDTYEAVIGNIDGTAAQKRRSADNYQAMEYMTTMTKRVGEEQEEPNDYLSTNHSIRLPSPHLCPFDFLAAPISDQQSLRADAVWRQLLCESIGKGHKNLVDTGDNIVEGQPTYRFHKDAIHDLQRGGEAPLPDIVLAITQTARGNTRLHFDKFIAVRMQRTADMTPAIDNSRDSVCLGTYPRCSICIICMIWNSRKEPFKGNMRTRLDLCCCHLDGLSTWDYCKLTSPKAMKEIGYQETEEQYTAILPFSRCLKTFAACMTCEYNCNETCKCVRCLNIGRRIRWSKKTGHFFILPESATRCYISCAFCASHCSETECSCPIHQAEAKTLLLHDTKCSPECEACKASCTSYEHMTDCTHASDSDEDEMHSDDSEETTTSNESNTDYCDGRVDDILEQAEKNLTLVNNILREERSNDSPPRTYEDFDGIAETEDIDAIDGGIASRTRRLVEKCGKDSITAALRPLAATASTAVARSCRIAARVLASGAAKAARASQSCSQPPQDDHQAEQDQVVAQVRQRDTGVPAAYTSYFDIRRETTAAPRATSSREQHAIEDRSVLGTKRKRRRKYRSSAMTPMSVMVSTTLSVFAAIAIFNTLFGSAASATTIPKNSAPAATNKAGQGAQDRPEPSRQRQGELGPEEAGEQPQDDDKALLAENDKLFLRGNFAFSKISPTLLNGEAVIKLREFSYDSTITGRELLAQISTQYGRICSQAAITLAGNLLPNGFFYAGNFTHIKDAHKVCAMKEAVRVEIRTYVDRDLIKAMMREKGYTSIAAGINLVWEYDLQRGQDHLTPFYGTDQTQRADLGPFHKPIWHKKAKQPEQTTAAPKPAEEYTVSLKSHYLLGYLYATRVRVPYTTVVTAPPEEDKEDATTDETPEEDEEEDDDTLRTMPSADWRALTAYAESISPPIDLSQTNFVYTYDAPTNRLALQLIARGANASTKALGNIKVDPICQKVTVSTTTGALTELALFACQNTFNNLVKNLRQVDTAIAAVIPASQLRDLTPTPTLDHDFHLRKILHQNMAKPRSKRELVSLIVLVIMGLIAVSAGVGVSAQNKIDGDRAYIDARRQEERIDQIELQGKQHFAMIKETRDALEESRRQSRERHDFAGLARTDIRYGQWSLRIKTDLLAGLNIIQMAVIAAKSGFTAHSVITDDELLEFSRDRISIYQQRLTTDRSFLRTDAYYDGNHITFSTRIPIIRKDNVYNIYKIISIPSKSSVDGQTHRPATTAEHYAFSTHDLSYTTLTTAEMAECTASHCEAANPPTVDQDCASGAFRNSTRLESCDYTQFPRNKNFLHTIGNATIYYFHEETEINKVCQIMNGQSSPTPEYREGPGILFTPAGCYWQAGTARISAVGTTYTEDVIGKLVVLPNKATDIRAIYRGQPEEGQHRTLIGPYLPTDIIDVFQRNIYKNPIQTAIHFSFPLLLFCMALATLLCLIRCSSKRSGQGRGRDQWDGKSRGINDTQEDKQQDEFCSQEKCSSEGEPPALPPGPSPAAAKRFSFTTITALQHLINRFSLESSAHRKSVHTESDYHNNLRPQEKNSQEFGIPLENRTSKNHNRPEET